MKETVISLLDKLDERKLQIVLAFIRGLIQ
jgi:hypothetical protein